MLGTCRFCKGVIWGEPSIYYSARHQAHPNCFVAALGWTEALERLTPWQSGKLARVLATEALATGSIEWPSGLRFLFGGTTEARELRLRRMERAADKGKD